MGEGGSGQDACRSGRQDDRSVHHDDQHREEGVAGRSLRAARRSSARSRHRRA